MKFRGFQFSFKKDMLKLTEKSCEIDCLTIYAYFMMRTQVISHNGGSVFVFVLVCITFSPSQFCNHLEEEERVSSFAFMVL